MPTDRYNTQKDKPLEAFRQVALVAIGANIPLKGELPEQIIARAGQRLAAGPLEFRALSRFFRTPCFPPGAGPDYINAAAAYAVPDGMNAAQVLAELHRVEAAFGRNRDVRWGMRTLDLDLIALGQQVAPDVGSQTAWRDLAPEAQQVRAPEELILPHPRLQDRAFVLIPLNDIAPGWRHPILRLTIAEMTAALAPAERAEIAAL